MTPRSRQRSILVVDDDDRRRESLNKTLSAAGYVVVAARGGVEALQRLRQRQFDLMITGVTMADIDGVQLSRKARRRYPGLPILFLAGESSGDSLISALSADGFPARPHRLSHIEALVESLLDGKAISARRPRVLIVDRDRRVREALADALDRNAYLPFSVPDCKEARREMENGDFDAVIAAYRLRNPSDTACLERMRNEHPGLSVIVTAGSSVGDSEPLPFSVDGIVRQPYSAADVVARLRDVLPADGTRH